MANKIHRAALVLAVLSVTGCTQGHGRATPKASSDALAVNPAELAEMLDHPVTVEVDAVKVDAAYRRAFTDLSRRCVEDMTHVYYFLSAAQREIQAESHQQISLLAVARGLDDLAGHEPRTDRIECGDLVGQFVRANT